jgi:predicted acetyltransferase
MQRQQRRRCASVLAGLITRSCAGGDDSSEAEVATLLADDVAVEVPGRYGSKLLVRPALPADQQMLELITAYSFARDTDPADVAAAEPRSEMPPTWGAFDELNRPVSSLVAYDWQLTGVAKCQVAAVAGVGTLPEYRRLGLLRTAMTMLFADMQQRGQPVAALYASQAAIYQRYGYAAAMPGAQQYSVDPLDIQWLDGVDGSCKVTRESVTQTVLPILSALYDSFIEGRVGGFAADSGARRTVSRLQTDSEIPGTGSPPTYCAIATDPSSGEPRGYVVYQLGGNWNDPSSGNTITPNHPSRGQKLTVTELIWSDIDSYKSLWSFLSRHDLVGEIKVMGVPADDPAPTLFTEPRMLRTTIAEGSWWRIVNVAGALESRSYAAVAAGGEALTLAVKDDEQLAPWNNGVWELVVRCEFETVSGFNQSITC